ncbi:MAG: carboxylesterase family protein, partial [Alphaproteobacteria bacterium]|nr:carboxylesterase family protein [Alphaproteobacteria bacterium]
GATHALDVPLIFGTLDEARPLLGEGEESRHLSDRMQEAWLAFAHKGDPGIAALPHWPPYGPESRATMIFDSECHVEHDVFGAVREALSG